MYIKNPIFFIGYDSKEDIAYRVCKQSLQKKSSIKIVAVPVGLKNKKVDLKAVIQVSKDISKGLKKGDTAILSPSLPPGTTENIVLPILEKGSKLIL